MKVALPLAALLLTACTANSPSPQGPEAPVPENYRAIGTEPGWSVTISPTRIEYQGDYGQTKIALPRPEPRTSFNGHRYEAKDDGHTLIVDVTHGQCNDGMSDLLYPDTVMVIADGKTVKGCGGAAIPPAALAGTSWTIQSIAGAPAISGRPATLSFDAGRLSGSSGCNRFSGGYTQAGDRLTIGAVAGTRMACPAALMEQERKLFAILSGEVGLSYRDGDTLVIAASAGEIVLKRAI